MIKNRIDPQYFTDKLKSILAAESRTPLEIGAKKQPKMEFLKSIIDVVELLFKNLYSVGEQLYLINTIDKNFSLTDTTYFKFLNTYLGNEYIILKKNRLFVSKIKFIKEVFSLFPDNFEKQFDLLGDFAKKYDLTLEDYVSFLNNYYLINNEPSIIGKKLDRYGEQESAYVPYSDNSLKKKTVVHKKPDTIKSVIGSVNKKKPKKKNPLKVTVENQSVSSRNDFVGLEKISTGQFFTQTSSSEEDDNNKKFHLNSGADVNVLPDIVKIIKDISLFPKEVLGTSFMLSDLDDRKNKINEEYLYLKDIRYIQWLDLKRLNLKDGQLIIEGKRSTQVFLSYRYYKEKLYFIEESQWNPDEYRIKDELNREFNKNSSLEVLEFEEKLALMEMYPSREV